MPPKKVNRARASGSNSPSGGSNPSQSRHRPQPMGNFAAPTASSRLKRKRADGEKDEEVELPQKRQRTKAFDAPLSAAPPPKAAAPQKKPASKPKSTSGTQTSVPRGRAPPPQQLPRVETPRGFSYFEEQRVSGETPRAPALQPSPVESPRKSVPHPHPDPAPTTPSPTGFSFFRRPSPQQLQQEEKEAPPKPTPSPRISAATPPQSPRSSAKAPPEAPHSARGRRSTSSVPPFVPPPSEPRPLPPQPSPDKPMQQPEVSPGRSLFSFFSGNKNAAVDDSGVQSPAAVVAPPPPSSPRTPLGIKPFVAAVETPKVEPILMTRASTSRISGAPVESPRGGRPSTHRGSTGLPSHFVPPSPYAFAAETSEPRGRVSVVSFKEDFPPGTPMAGSQTPVQQVRSRRTPAAPGRMSTPARAGVSRDFQPIATPTPWGRFSSAVYSGTRRSLGITPSPKEFADLTAKQKFFLVIGMIFFGVICLMLLASVVAMPFSYFYVNYRFPAPPEWAQHCDPPPEIATFIAEFAASPGAEYLHIAQRELTQQFKCLTAGEDAYRNSSTLRQYLNDTTLSDDIKRHVMSVLLLTMHRVDTAARAARTGVLATATSAVRYTRRLYWEPHFGVVFGVLMDRISLHLGRPLRTMDLATDDEVGSLIYFWNWAVCTANTKDVPCPLLEVRLRRRGGVDRFVDDLAAALDYAPSTPP